MPSYKELEEALGEAIGLAKALPPLEPRGEPLIAASRGAEPPAIIYYYGLIHSGARAILASPSDIAFHLTPYREFEATVVAFTIDGKDTRVVHAVEAAVNLGLHAIVVTPGLHPAYESRLQELGAEIIQVPARAPILAMAVASLHWVPRLMGFREERYREEVASLGSSVEWAKEGWGGEIEEAKGIEGGAPGSVYYTPAARPGAYYYCRLHSECREPLPLEALLEEPRGARPIVFMTSVEEHSFKDVLLAANMRGVKPITVRINTDPITAGFYSMLVASMILGRVG